MGAWRDGAHSAICLSFDNLGVDEQTSAVRVLPSLLEALAQRDLAATFFVEGVNAELCPDALGKIAAAGHEVAYHAWCHEQWGELSAAERGENLARGIEAFAGLGIELAGLRPPGGRLGEGGVELLREAGLRYASPAGAGAGIEDGLALLAFEWRHVDATSMLPGLDPVREQMTGSPAPLDPAAFLAYLETEIDRVASEGGFAALVLHLPLLEWWGPDRLAQLLTRLQRAREDGAIWLAPCADVAAHVLADPRTFVGGVTPDPTSWDG